MALYLGRDKVKINLGGTVYHLNLLTNTLINDIRLLSSDNFILKDSNGLYLITGKSNISDAVASSIDGYILKDQAGKYLITQEDE